MFCIYCGSQIEESFKVCPNCGALVDQQEQANNNQPNFQPNVSPNPFPCPTTNRKTGLEIAALIMTIFAGLLVLGGLTGFEEIIDGLDQEQVETLGAVGTAISAVLIQVGLVVAAFFMGLSARKANKNGMNVTVMVLSALVFALSIVEVILIVNHLS